MLLCFQENFFLVLINPHCFVYAFTFPTHLIFGSAFSVLSTTRKPSCRQEIRSLRASKLVQMVHMWYTCLGIHLKYNRTMYTYTCGESRCRMTPA